MKDLREQLAALAHARWSHWMSYLFEQAEQDANGNVTIPVALVNRWKRQIKTAYSDLSESEKDSDRQEADMILHLLMNLEDYTDENPEDRGSNYPTTSAV